MAINFLLFFSGIFCICIYERWYKNNAYIFIYWLFDICFKFQLAKKYSFNIMKFAINCIILYQILCYYFPSAKDFVPNNLSLRMDDVFEFYDIVSFSNLFLPLHFDIKIIDYLHNEVLTILSVAGFLGVFLYYRTLYKKIKIILDRNIGVAMSLSMVIIIGGVLVLPTLHPSTGILIAYLVSFYSSIGNKFIYKL